jgi:hypothetical protein
MARSPLTFCALFLPTVILVACSSSSGDTSSGTGGSKMPGTSSSTGTTTTNGTGGATGTGGTGGVGTACTDMADTMALAQNKDNIGGDVLSCTLANTGNTSAISMCLQMKDGLSPACSTCFAEDGDCGAMNCLAQCAGGSSSPGCESCLAAHCNNAFTQCSGISGQQPDGGTDGGGGDGG